MNKTDTPADMDLLALKVFDLLTEYELMEDTSVYGNFQYFCSRPWREDAQERTTPQGRRVYACRLTPEEAPLVWEKMETIVVTFEGNQLYEEMNHTPRLGIRDRLDELFSPFGLYLERWDQCSLYAKIWEP